MTATFEALLAELLDEQATQEQPPARVSVTAAIRRGNSLLRCQRAGLIAVPALAASIVVAIALTGGVLFGGRPGLRTSRTGSEAAASGLPDSPGLPPVQTGSLPVLGTDASFGWLPAGDQLRSGFASTTMAYMNIDAGRDFSWELTTWAPGACALRNGDEEISCQPGGYAPENYRVGGSTAPIRGREAFWVDFPEQYQGLIWEYRAGAWAVFQTPNRHRQPVATLLRIARGISFGRAGGQPIRFDLQLTDVPSDWSVSSVSYAAKDGFLLANAVDLTGQHSLPTGTSIRIGKGGVGNADACWNSAARPTKHTVLRGYDVQTTTNPAADSHGGSDTHELCAPDVDGSSIDITTPTDSMRTPAELFEHMRLLETNPADWVTNPIG